MIEIFNGDCLEVIKNIPNKSIDLVVTDPPYEVENKEAVNNLLQNIFSDIALSGDIYFFDAETDIDADITEKIETKQYSEKVYISKTETEEKYQFEWSSEIRS